jgi:hypothetical protein
MTDLTGFLANLTEIVTALTTMFTSIMIVFMEPPLSLFIGVALFVMVIGIVGRYLMGRGK